MAKAENQKQKKGDEAMDSDINTLFDKVAKNMSVLKAINSGNYESKQEKRDKLNQKKIHLNEKKIYSFDNSLNDSSQPQLVKPKKVDDDFTPIDILQKPTFEKKPKKKKKQGKKKNQAAYENIESAEMPINFNQNMTQRPNFVKLVPLSNNDFPSDRLGDIYQGTNPVKFDQSKTFREELP